MAINDITLTSGTTTLTIPQLGFGVWQVPDEDTPAAIASALETGYRHIDTARIYGNEDGVGRALAETEIPREDIFVTTKVWNDDQGSDQTTAAFEQSMERLGLDTLDLYLIHWPTPARDAYVETWSAMRALRDAGRVRAIGVCNFAIEHLQRLFDETGEWPALNQIELHPYLSQQELREFHGEHGIATEAWSPLGQGGDVLSDPVITEIAARLGATPAQVILRWHLDLGNVTIPKSVTPSRIAENFAAADLELTADDREAISGLTKGQRLGPDPLEFNG